MILMGIPKLKKKTTHKERRKPEKLSLVKGKPQKAGAGALPAVDNSTKVEVECLTNLVKEICAKDPAKAAKVIENWVNKLK